MSKDNGNLEDLIQRYNQELLRYHQRNRVRVPLEPQEEKPAPPQEAPAVETDAVPIVAAERGRPAVSQEPPHEPVVEYQPDTTAELNAEPDAAQLDNEPMRIVSPQLVPEVTEELPKGATGQSLEEIMDEPPATDTGYIIIQASTARKAVPVPGAHVTISRYTSEGEVLHKIAVTDVNGKTPVVALPAASRELSQQPGVDHPYTSYTVRINAPGYIPVRDFRVPVYGGVTAIQPVELIPLPEPQASGQGEIGSIDIVESGPQDL